MRLLDPPDMACIVVPDLRIFFGLSFLCLASVLVFGLWGNEGSQGIGSLI
jgi:hypothetical protein